MAVVELRVVLFLDVGLGLEEASLFFGMLEDSDLGLDVVLGGVLMRVISAMSSTGRSCIEFKMS